MATITNKALVKEALIRAVDKIYPSYEDLEKTLLSGQELKIYLGVDPTGPHLHLGHATNLLVLKRFQDLGHKIIFLIGDFTARIGDPSDKTSMRQPLTPGQIKENLKTFKKQASKILRFSGKNAVKVDYNSRWWKKMNFGEIIQLAHNFTVQQMMQRDMFQNRLRSNKPIGLHEFLYPLMQGYDSVALDIDMEIGGSDQTFNMLAGRDLLKTYKNKDKFVLTTKLLENSKTGKKLMNKSEGGLINLDDEPNDMYGKVMAIEDEVMYALAEFSTIMPMDEVGSLKDMSPRDAKAKVAYWAVKTFFGEGLAKKAEDEFNKVFRSHELPDDIPVHKTSQSTISIVDLLIETKLAPSKSEARRLIEQGGVKVNENKILSSEDNIAIYTDGVVLQVGKRHFIKVIV